MSARLCLMLTLVGIFSAPGYAQKIYWAETIYEGDPPVARHLIRRANPDGSNVEDAVDCGQHAPYAIALDLPRRHVYWTVTGGAIFRAGLDGSQVEQVLLTAEPWGIAVDILGQRMYWGFGFDFGLGVRRARLDGSDIETIYWGDNAEPERLAVDAVGGKLYWTIPGELRILRANLDGSQVETLVNKTQEPRPWGIAVDPIHRKMYWTLASRSSTVSGKLQRANLDGTQVEDLATIGGGWPEVAVDPYGGKVYWTERFAVRRADLDGTNIEDVTFTNREYEGAIGFDLVPPIPALSPYGLVAVLAGMVASGLLIMCCRRAGLDTGTLGG